ncbi:MAG: MATE family efflux transporter [Coriobacteriales bacterium]|jgi:multidrug efflux pump
MNERKMAKTEVFRNASVPKAVVSNALPAMAAMLMVLIYNIADTFFIGQTGDALQVAAVSLATPVYLIFMTLGTVFGIGGTSLISRSLGAGRQEYAKHICAFCFWGCIFSGIGLLVLMFVFMEQILVLIGASSETFPLAESYLSIVCCCGPLVILCNCFSNILRAEGQSGKGMMGMTLGNLANVVLDPIFILAFGWGISGAAVATVLGNIVGAGYYLLYFLRGKSSLSISIREAKLGDGICKGVLAIGIPAAIGDLMMSVSQIVANAQMTAYGDMAVAGLGVAMKVSMMTGMVCIGLGQGVQPLLGFCYGANLRDRYRKSLRFSIVFAFSISTSLTILCYVFTSQIVGAFLTEPSAFDSALEFSRILLTTSFLFGAFYVTINALQSLGAATESLIVSLSRQGIIYLPALFILQQFMGMDGILWAQPVADVLSLALAIVLYRHTRKSKWAGMDGKEKIGNGPKVSSGVASEGDAS